ncbi:MAG: hypothetical protein IT436_15825 [Phycisphaerales bacterium]|nr:hypothetical protein [Phycisphaerales bacterium]
MTYWVGQYPTPPLPDGVYRVFTTILPEEPVEGPAVRVGCASPHCEPGPLGDPDGVDGPVAAMTAWDPDGSGPIGEVLVAGGSFSTAGGVPARHIAAWDGTAWSGLGTGLDGPVAALTVYDGRVIAGGRFSIAGGTPAFGVAAWDGAAWHPLGGGITGQDDSVTALAVLDGRLIVGGSFAQAGGVTACNIAAWDGVQWHALGAGLEYAPTALVSHAGDLMAAVGGVYRWNGSEWNPVGAGFPTMYWQHVTCLASYGGSLMAGTSGFMYQGAWVALWDGAQWIGVGGVWDTPYTALTVFDGALIAANNTPYSGVGSDVARWDGMGWTYLGNVDGAVRAFGALQGQLVGGGEFTSVGSVEVANVVRWNCPMQPCPIDFTGDGIVDFADYLEFLDLHEALDSRADLNGDGVIDFGDYLEFLNHYEAGC